MLHRKIFLPVLIVICSMTACISPPEYDDVPEIEFISISTDIVDEGFLVQPVEIVFGFTDGDGDLGSDTTRNIFLVDPRIEEPIRYRIPFIEPQGTNNGISGEITIELTTSVQLCCLTPETQIPCSTPSPNFPLDTMVYELYILDEAGNQSNTISTTPIILRCNQ